jgi:maltose O-acetyltransferase
MLRRIRTAIEAITTRYWRARVGGRIEGRHYRLVRPDRLVIAPDTRLVLGKNVLVDLGAKIHARSAITIGDGTYIGPHAVIVAYEPITIGSRVLFGERVSIHTEDHGPPGNRGEHKTAPITIEDDVWLCAGVVVTRGVTIGARSTVGANAVVTSDVPPDSLAIGVPAKVVRS